VKRHRRLPFSLVAASIIAAVAFAGCGDGSDPVVAGPRRAMLAGAAEQVILPTYVGFSDRTDDLVTAAELLWMEPTPANLDHAQATWRAVRRIWKQSEAFRFGPVEDLQLRIRTKIDWTPVRPDRIEEEIASLDDLTPGHVDTLGTNRRGFNAIEYLWFDPEGGDAVVLDRLTGADGDRRRQFAWAIAGDIRTQAGKLVDAWLPEGGDFVGELVHAGQTSTTYPTLKDAVDTVVGAVVYLASQIEENKLGRPFGSKSNGVPRPESVEAPYSGNALADVDANLDSIERVYLGALHDETGTGMSALVARVNVDLDATIRAAITRVRNAARGIGLPLAEAVVDEHEQPRVAAAVAAANELRVLLSVDMVSALGATPRIVGDGD
jgi:predicted lipoprotein